MASPNTCPVFSIAITRNTSVNKNTTQKFKFYRSYSLTRFYSKGINGLTMSDKREDDENGAEFTNLKSTSTSTATDSDSSQEGLEGIIQVISEFIVRPYEICNF